VELGSLSIKVPLTASSVRNNPASQRRFPR
jgi:hypothetical protein